jgi:hypothetical protein
MSHRMLAAAIALGLILGISALAQSFRPYAGSKVDKAATEEAARYAAGEPGLEMTVYFSNDPFDKVYSYYKQHAHEYEMAGKRTRKLPDGQELRDAFFLLDEANDLVSSKMWIKIQRPYIGPYGLAKGVKPADVTAIVLSRRK